MLWRESRTTGVHFSANCVLLSRSILNYFELRMWKIHLARFLNLDNSNFSSFFSLCAFLVLWIFQQQDGVKGTARQYDRCVRIKDDANLAYKIQMETLINPWLDVIRLQREWMMLGKTVNMLKNVEAMRFIIAQKNYLFISLLW